MIFVDAEQYFEELMCQCHTRGHDGVLLVGGDFNARCVDHSEYIEGVDQVTHRDMLDHTSKTYGDLLIDVMLSINVC